MLWLSRGSVGGSYTADALPGFVLTAMPASHKLRRGV